MPVRRALDQCGRRLSPPILKSSAPKVGCPGPHLNLHVSFSPVSLVEWHPRSPAPATCGGALSGQLLSGRNLPAVRLNPPFRNPLQDLYAEIEAQRQACERIISSKDSLISEVRGELKKKDDEFVKTLKRQVRGRGLMTEVEAEFGVGYLLQLYL
jgi:hypothetical protein